MSLVIKEVGSKNELKDFIHLPGIIHRDHSEWIPPIYHDEWNYFNPLKNKAFSYSETILLLAYRDRKAVGRIMGIINNRFNEQYKTQDARFEFIESYNDPEIVSGLLRYVEDWARAKGMNKMVGPMGFSDKDPQGLLIEGFDKQAIIATACNFPYMVDLVIGNGYIKKVDLLDYIIKIPDEPPALYQRINERIEQSGDMTVEGFSRRSQLKPLIKPVFELINITYSNIYGFIPLDNEEIDELSKRYLPVIKPEFVKVVRYKGKMIAFIIGIPCISNGIKKAGGRLFPFGFYYILKSLDHATKLDLMLGAVHDDFRNRGVDVMMAMKIFESCRKQHISLIESHLVLETNLKMLAELKKANGEIIKRFRIFQKDL